MLTNDNSKIKYPSFRIDDILNNDFGISTDSQTTNDFDDFKLSKFKNAKLIDDKFNDKIDDEDKFDQPINLSSIKYRKDELFNSVLPATFNLEKYENLTTKSSISSSSPTLSVGSNDSPTFNHLTPISKSPIIDQLMKCNLNDANNLKTTILNSSICRDDSNTFNDLSNDLSKSILINQQNSQLTDDFFIKLNKNQFSDKEITLNRSFDAMNYDKSMNADDHSPIDFNDTFKKIHQKCKCFFVAIKLFDG